MSGADVVQVLGGGAGILAFTLVLVKTLNQDRIWRDLIQSVREDLKECREDKGRLEEKVSHLENEVISLRRELHLDRWIGVDPVSRPGPFDQDVPKEE